MLIGFASAKGAPGVTTAALALGLSSDRAVLVESDLSGGVLAPRTALRFDPGASSLAAAARHELTVELFAEHLQSIGPRLAVLTAPSDPRAARHAFGVLGDRLPSLLRSIADVHGLFDLGRFDADSPMRPVARLLDILVLLASPSLEGIDALAIRLNAMDELRERAVLVTAGEGPYRPEECASALSLPLGGHLPRDDAAASSLWRDLAVERVHRRPFGRAVVDLARTLGVSSLDVQWHPPVEAPSIDEDAALDSAELGQDPRPMSGALDSEGDRTELNRTELSRTRLSRIGLSRIGFDRSGR